MEGSTLSYVDTAGKERKRKLEDDIAEQVYQKNKRSKVKHENRCKTEYDGDTAGSSAYNYPFQSDAAPDWFPACQFSEQDLSRFPRTICRETDVTTLLGWFTESPLLHRIIFSEKLQPCRRAMLHFYCRKYRLQSRTYGPQTRRVLLVSKKGVDEDDPGDLDRDLPSIFLCLLVNNDIRAFTFFSNLDSKERKQIHQQCQRHGLHSESVGKGDCRSLVLHKGDASCIPPVVKRHAPSARPPGWDASEKKPQVDAHVNAQLLQGAAVEYLQRTKPLCIQPMPSYMEGGRYRNKCGVWASEPLLGDQVKMCIMPSLDCVFFCSAEKVARFHHCIGTMLSIPTDILERLRHTAPQITPSKVRHRGPRPYRPHVPPPDAQYNIDNEALQSFADQRNGLPIFAHKAEILESIKTNKVTILDGPTGSGKTTQVPQYIVDCPDLLLPNTPIVLITQPRRIAAINTAIRVSRERGQAVGEEVGYQVRFESQVGPTTRIIYLTSGILLRKLQADPALTGVGCVIIDEVHERSLDIDFCLLIMKQLLVTKKTSAKLVIMSATLQANVFVQYFKELSGPQPAGQQQTMNHVHFDGRSFNVNSFFVEAALHWTGFRTNPNTGIAYRAQAATQMNCTKLLRASLEDSHKGKSILMKELRKLDKASLRARSTSDAPDVIDLLYVQVDLIAALVMVIHQTGIPGGILVFLPGLRDIEKVHSILQGQQGCHELLILTVHSLLPRNFQQMLFKPPPKNMRKIVLATNIAESSITIQDITFVIDSGLTKGLKYDPNRDISSLDNMQVSQANIIQRRGRAGRVRPGVAIHLIPQSLFDQLDKTPVSELLRVPLEEVCLRIKALYIDDVHAFLAQAIDPPERRSIDNALQQLQKIGALDAEQRLSELGWVLAAMPLHPRLGKLFILASLFGVLDPVAIIAAFMSVRSPFVATLDPATSKEFRTKRMGFIHHLMPSSDYLMLLQIYNAWDESDDKAEFCGCYGLHFNTMKEVSNTAKLYLQSFQYDMKFEDSPLYHRHEEDEVLVSAVVSLAMYPKVVMWSQNRWYNPYDGPAVELSRDCALSCVQGRQMPLDTILTYFEQTAAEGHVRVGISGEISPLSVALVCQNIILVDHYHAPVATAGQDCLPKPAHRPLVSCDSWLFLQLPSDMELNILFLVRSAMTSQLMNFASSRSFFDINKNFMDALAAAIGGRDQEGDPKEALELFHAAALSMRSSWRSAKKRPWENPRTPRRDRRWKGLPPSYDSDDGEEAVVILEDSEYEL